MKVSCTVKNTGKRIGDEVVQLYLRDEISSVTTYVKILRGFERITLQPERRKRSDLYTEPTRPRHLGQNMKFQVEPGTFKVMIGASSKDIKLEGKFTINK